MNLSNRLLQEFDLVFSNMGNGTQPAGPCKMLMFVCQATLAQKPMLAASPHAVHEGVHSEASAEICPGQYRAANAAITFSSSEAQ
jgi:hypothetical protein